MSQTITVAHSPDADDAFMFYGLAKGKVDTAPYTVKHVLCDIQTLNEEALRGTYEISAISFHAYPEVQKLYRPMHCGASFGEKDYGPMIVKKKTTTHIRSIAVPGEKTSAFLLFKLWNQDIPHVVVPFDQILEAVDSGKVDAGLIIHEGQLFYEKFGLECIINFGKWWYDQHKLPLPLGGNVVRRDLPADLQKTLTRWVRESIQHSLANRSAALDYALQYARDLPVEKADRFVGMYVNERTVDMGDDGKKAVQTLLRLGKEKGIVSLDANLDWLVT